MSATHSGSESEDDFEHVNLTHSDSTSWGSDAASADDEGDMLPHSPGESIASPIHIDDGEESDVENEGMETFSSTNSSDGEASDHGEEDSDDESIALFSSKEPDRDISYIYRANERHFPAGGPPDPSDPDDDDDDDDDYDPNQDDSDDDSFVSDSDEEGDGLWQHPQCLLTCRPLWEKTHDKSTLRKGALRQAVKVIKRLETLRWRARNRTRQRNVTIAQLRQQLIPRGGRREVVSTGD